MQIEIQTEATKKIMFIVAENYQDEDDLRSFANPRQVITGELVNDEVYTLPFLILKTPRF